MSNNEEGPETDPFYRKLTSSLGVIGGSALLYSGIRIGVDNAELENVLGTVVGGGTALTGIASIIGSYKHYRGEVNFDQ